MFIRPIVDGITAEEFAAIDADYLSEEELRACGARLSEEEPVTLPGFSAMRFEARRNENIAAISDAYLATLQSAEAGELITPAAEWLIDNFYRVEETARQVKRDLPRRYFRSLPVVAVRDCGLVPRALALAWVYVSHSRCDVTEERLTALVEGFQQRQGLRIGELWSVPSLLRFVLLDDLARLARRIDRAREMRDRANAVADKLLAAPSPEARLPLLRASEAEADNDTFASQLLYRLSDEGAADAISWIEARLEERESNADEVQIVEQNRMSAGNARIANIIRSLRAIDDIDWKEWFVSLARVDAVLRARSNFDALDFTSQDQYRGAVEQLARWSEIDEEAVAGRALDMSRAAGADVGETLVGARRPELEASLGCRLPVRVRLARAWRRLGWVGIAVPVIALTLALLAALSLALQAAGVGSGAAALLTLLAALPASEAAVAVFNNVVTAILRPSRLVGFAFEDGVPAECRTLVVIPCLIDSHDTIDDLTRALEVHYLSQTRGELYFALLSDWPDASAAREEHDDELLDRARAEIARLAELYAHDGRTRFFLLHRRRLLNEAEGAWMGWERKRGKLIELCDALRGEIEHTTFLPPDVALPEGIRYVMTLDADTRLTRDAVTKLVGKLAHPMNRPVVDERAGRVVEGHAILQPRVTPSLTAGAEASAFQRIFSANRGLDPYVFTVSDVYQDLTGEGSFTGKGLFDVDAFEQVLGGVFPDNAILSHDLLEGTLARAALATDVEVVEDFPVRYEVEDSRQHRWARGDWQLAPFLFFHGVTNLGRWKMLDNLRRSLAPIAWVAASVVGWATLAPRVAAGWQAALVLSLFAAPILGLLRQFRPRGDVVLKAEVFGWSRAAASALAQGGLQLAFMAERAALMADAILRTLHRMLASRRHLLQWRSAARVAAQAHGTPLDYARAMALSIGIGAAGILLAWATGGAVVIAALFGGLWIAAPAIAWYVSRTAETEGLLRVSPGEVAALRRVARRTWAYYEEFVTAEHHWLPPDNFQEIPHPVVAGRTSPTNIGCYLLSVVSARDFGWIGLAATVSRLEDTLASVQALPKHNGHLYNWYDTRRAVALEPRYVSTVDSGNLAGHLICLSAACRDWAEATFATLLSDPAGIGDVIGVLAEELASVPNERRVHRPLRRRLEECLADLDRALRTLDEHAEFPSARILNLSMLANEFDKLAREYDRELGSERTRSVVRWAGRLRQTCEASFADATLEAEAATDLSRRLANLRDVARGLAFSMQFGFLLNERRQLLSIGCRPDQGQLDENCYDLLASEARLTSFFGIAKGDLPTEHWFHLGRPLTTIDARGALLSWSGSMFEYLMAPLVMQERQGSILDQTNRLVVRCQIGYGRLRGVPWGISEAGLNARDPEMTYQYRNFGVPALGLKRGLGRDLVIAPYATLLAAQIDPVAALRNLATLRGLGALGEFGYYESIDFTPTRLPKGADHAVVRNYMAHHVGMSILAVANVAFSGLVRDRFHSDPVIEAAELLLQEKAPRSVPALVSRESAMPVTHRGEAEEAIDHRVIDDPLRADRATALLSNGHYALILTAVGSGRASWNGLAVTRWRPDPTEDRWGSFVFLRDVQTGDWWSATAEPRQVEGEVARTVLSDSRVEFHKQVGRMRSLMEVVVASEHDAEGRRLTLTNGGPRDRVIEVTSYAEPVLFRADADEAHPAFAKMFLKTEIDVAAGTIHVERRPRGPGEPDMSVAHIIVAGDAAEGGIEAETDRRAFIGRGRTLAGAAAFDRGARLGGADGFTLDPILSLRRRVRVPAGKSVTVIFWTIAAPRRSEVDAAIAYLAHPEAFEHAAMHSWTRSQIQQYHFGMGAEESSVFQKLARYLVYPDATLRAEMPPSAAAPQSALWSLGISGDFPIFLLRIDAEADLPIARKALRAQQYFRARGLHADLVLMNEHATSYSQELQNALDPMCENARLRAQSHGGPPEHIFALRRDLMDPATYAALVAAARVVFHARNGKLSTQIERAEAAAAQAAAPAAPRPAPGGPLRPPVAGRPGGAGDLVRWNGLGGFSADGREYVLRRPADRPTPQPWINVVSNGAFGFHVAAEGGGFTWSVNSRDYRLTPWSNDAVVDAPGEGFFVVDRDSGAVATPFSALAAHPGAVFETRHGMGYSEFRCEDGGLDIRLTQTVHAVDPVKLSRLRIVNRGPAARRLRVYGYVEWVLGNSRERTAPFVVTARDPATGALVARNTYGIEYRGRAAVFHCDAAATTVTASRAEFVGAGSTRRPEAVAAGRALSGDLSATGDPCAAIAADVALGPGEATELLFTLGDAAGEAEAGALVGRRDFAGAMAEVRAEWGDFLDVLQVETPDPAFDLMVNAWLPYQTLACRLRARSAFYQASGAFGFRDQLQDSLALMLHDPGLARAQILNAAGRQFEAGDVQHWWLPATGAGVRTMISDDVVWLAYAVLLYVATTGESAILDTPLRFLRGAELAAGQHDAFFTPDVSDETASLFEHCARALDLAVARTGANGLSLILGGDWNDGMDRVGVEGRGESVWLSWFLAAALDGFAPIAEARGEAERAARYRGHIEALRAAIETAGWDGEAYRRGYYDDGAPLGSVESDECQLDSIAQSWAVLSGQGPEDRANRALDRVLEVLVDREAQLVRLFTPPFENTTRDPGYIKGYPPGVRENGGQYTHAATWVVYALARLGRADEAYRLFSMLNPTSHSGDEAAAERYRVEPYVVAADIYSVGEKRGRGGWTWYTGSAGWMYRTAVEAILGVTRRGDRLHVRPALPGDWPGYDLRLRIGGRLRRIEVRREGEGYRVSVDGKAVTEPDGVAL